MNQGRAAAMQTLRNVLEEVAHQRVAVGHFNISELAALQAIVAAARDLNVPVVVGVSEGERDFMGVRQVAALVKSVRDEFDHPIFLNADHTHTLLRRLHRFLFVSMGHRTGRSTAVWFAVAELLSAGFRPR